MSNDSERKLPTRPGWWLIKADPRDTSGGLPYEAVVVYQGRGGLLVSGRTPNRVDQNGGITWLAPIPCPDVLAALAEYSRLDALIEGSNEVHADQPDVLRVMLRRAEALTALALAIRAERDGAA